MILLMESSQSCALHLVVGHDETIEYLVYLVIGNTASGIGYMKNNLFFLQFIPEADRTFGGEFRSITYQIGENLKQAVPVCRDNQ